MRSPFSWSKLPPKALPPNTVTLRVRILAYECWGDTFSALHPSCQKVRGYTMDSPCMKGIIPVLDLFFVTVSRICFYKVTTDCVRSLKLDCISVSFVRNIRLSCQIRVLGDEYRMGKFWRKKRDSSGAQSTMWPPEGSIYSTRISWTSYFTTEILGEKGQTEGSFVLTLYLSSSPFFSTWLTPIKYIFFHSNFFFPSRVTL